MDISFNLPKTMVLAKDLVGEYVRVLEGRSKGEKQYIDSGFAELDRHLPAWLHSGHLIVIAGRPTMGKTAFAQQLSENAAESGHTVLFFSLEMSSHEITERSIMRRSGVSTKKLKTGNGLNKNEWEAITRAFQEFAPLPFIADETSFTLSAIINNAKAAAASLKEKGLPPLGCIVVDYLQLVSTDRQAANRTLEVGQISTGLKRMAKDLSVPVIALSQLNRSVEGRDDKRPTLSDLRDSGQIEQDADLVLFLYRDEYYNKDKSPDLGIAELIAAKNRHGSVCTVKLRFTAERAMFGCL